MPHFKGLEACKEGRRTPITQLFVSFTLQLILKINNQLVFDAILQPIMRDYLFKFSLIQWCLLKIFTQYYTQAHTNTLCSACSIYYNNSKG